MALPISYENFNLLNEFNILRIICGAFFIPHIIGKFFVPEALGFFVAAGYKPPKFWMYLAACVETVLAIGLILGIYTPYVAAIAAFDLLIIICVSIHLLTHGKWLWNTGGYEYPAFWGICCIVVAMHG